MRRLVTLFVAAALPLVGNTAELSVAPTGTPALETLAAPRSFVATYAVNRNGKALGESSMRLHDEGGDRWSLTTQTHGTAGMARLLGLDVTEQSTFRWRGSYPEALVYDYDQDAAIKRKKRHASFDWQAKTAEVSEGKNSYTYAIEAGTMDRHCVGIALARAMEAGESTAQLDVAVKDHVEHQRFERVEPAESLQVPAGRYDTWRVERIDVSGKGRSWFAQKPLPVPVHVEQLQGDGGSIVMELSSFKYE